MKTTTDHDLLQITDKWVNELPNKELIGIQTAFAAGFRYAEKLNMDAVRRYEKVSSRKLKDAFYCGRNTNMDWKDYDQTEHEAD